MNIPNILDNVGIEIINKTTNKIKKKNDKIMINTIINRCKYPHKKNAMQRIRKEHIDNGTVKTNKDEKYKYPMIQDGFSRKKYPFPGGLCYYNYKMIDMDSPKIIITNIGFEIGYDKEGIYNLSDSLSYINATEEEYNLFKQFVESKLINFLLEYYKNNTQFDAFKKKKKSLYYIPFNEMESDEKIYNYFNLTTDEITLIERTV